MATTNQLVFARVGTATISVVNPNLDGSGPMEPVITAPDDGLTIHSITIKATGNTTQGMVRLFIRIGSVVKLWREIMVPAVTQGVMPAFCEVIEGTLLQTDQVLFASTQNNEEFVVTAEGVSWRNCACA